MHKEARVAAKATRAQHRVKAVCSRVFLLQRDVPAGLSARRLDLRRRRAEITFAAGLGWDRTKRASARFGLIQIFCQSAVLFRKGG